MNETTEVQACYKAPLSAWWRDTKYSLWLCRRRWQERRLYRLLDAMEGDSNLVAHVRREVPPGDGEDDNMQDAMRAHLIRMAQLFAIEGHSGFSASYAVGALERLLRFEPLGPLTGEDDEWTWLGYDPEMEWQNKRASHVFKRLDGTAYDIDGRIFREPNGACFTSRDSAVEVTFPYTPTREYIDVEDDHDDA